MWFPHGRVKAYCVFLTAFLLSDVSLAENDKKENASLKDPDTDLNTPQTIRRNGYPAETHTVQTADGYLLAVHRIPVASLSSTTRAPPPSEAIAAAAAAAEAEAVAAVLRTVATAGAAAEKARTAATKAETRTWSIPVAAAAAAPDRKHTLASGIAAATATATTSAPSAASGRTATRTRTAPAAASTTSTPTPTAGKPTATQINIEEIKPRRVASHTINDITTESTTTIDRATRSRTASEAGIAIESGTDTMGRTARGRGNGIEGITGTEIGTGIDVTKTRSGTEIESGTEIDIEITNTPAITRTVTRLPKKRSLTETLGSATTTNAPTATQTTTTPTTGTERVITTTHTDLHRTTPDTWARITPSTPETTMLPLREEAGTRRTPTTMTTTGKEPTSPPPPFHPQSPPLPPPRPLPLIRGPTAINAASITTTRRAIPTRSPTATAASSVTGQSQRPPGALHRDGAILNGGTQTLIKMGAITKGWVTEARPHTTTNIQDPTNTPSATESIPPTPPTPSPPPPVVFLQHGLLGSSYDWILAGPGKALAYLLADAGFDVWMGNARGNTYSRAHVYLPTEPSSSFWDFSFHEMGVYDLPAVFAHILNVTGAERLHYVGHSMGTTMFFAMASVKPATATTVVASMHALAPVVFVRSIKSPIRLLAPFAHDVEFLARLLGVGEFLPQTKILHYLAKYGCELLEAEKEICENLLFILCGYDKDQFNSSVLPALLSHTPAGASTQTLIHYAQMIRSGKFQQYDYGKYDNLKEYSASEPPSYDLSQINVPINLMYANNDWLASVRDVEDLYDSLQCEKKKFLISLKSFNHLDFILAKDVKPLVYNTVVNDLQRDSYIDGAFSYDNSIFHF